MQNFVGKTKCIAGYMKVANSARPPKIPGWIVVVRENFSVNKRVCRK